MIRHGEAPFLECSSRGDRRFSAFYAVPYPDDPRTAKYTIEAIYQSMKIFEGGLTGLSIKEAKGRPGCVNLEEMAEIYGELWEDYIERHPELLQVLKAATGLSDIFGQPGHCCQATELWRIRNSVTEE